MNNDIKAYLNKLPIKKDLTCCEMIIKNSQESDIMNKIRYSYCYEKLKDESKAQKSLC